MDEQLREWADEERQRMAPPGLEAVLLGKLRRRRWERRMWFAAPLAAAAVIVLLWRPVATVAPVPVAKVVEPPKVAPVVVAKAVAKPKRVVAKPKPVEPAPFVAVGAWQAVEPIERGRIVRAEVPRATLASYGMPVGRGRWSEPAPVELLLGEDGTVRGMRVVPGFQ